MIPLSFSFFEHRSVHTFEHFEHRYRYWHFGAEGDKLYQISTNFFVHCHGSPKQAQSGQGKNTKTPNTGKSGTKKKRSDAQDRCQMWVGEVPFVGNPNSNVPTLRESEPIAKPPVSSVTTMGGLTDSTLSKEEIASVVLPHLSTFPGSKDEFFNACRVETIDELRLALFSDNDQVLGTCARLMQSMSLPWNDVQGHLAGTLTTKQKAQLHKAHKF